MRLPRERFERKPHDKLRKRKHFLLVHYVNANSFSQKLWSFIRDRSEFDQHALVETHLPTARQTRFLINYVRLVGNLLNSPQHGPSPRSAKGTTGGAAILARSHLRVGSSLDVLSCANPVEDHEPIDFAAAIVHGCHSRILLVTCYLTDSQGASALNLTKLARMGALIQTMHLPYVIVGDFNMSPAQLTATQWIDQIGGHFVIPQETVSTWSSGGRMIDFAVISPALTRNVVLSLDLDAPFAAQRSFCLKLHLSTSHITSTSQLRPPPMSREPEGDVKSVVANEIWSGLESVSTVVRREQGPCPALKASVVFRTFGAASSLLQPNGSSQPTGAFGAICGCRYSSTTTLVGSHSLWASQIPRNEYHRSPFMERRGHFRPLGEMVAHSISSIV